MQNDSQRDDARRGMGGRRAAAFWLSLVAASVATVATGVALLDEFQVEYRQVGLSLGLNTAWGLGMLRANSEDVPAIAFLGDSTVMAFPEGKDIPFRFEQELRTRMRHPPAVWSLGTFGMSFYEYYAIIDMVVDAAPMAVVLPVNLNAFGVGWRDHWNRTEMVALLPAAELPYALNMDLEWWGVTTDKLLLWKFLAVFAPTRRWLVVAQEQVRAGVAVEDLRRWLQGEHGGSGMPEAGPFLGWAKRLSSNALPAMEGVGQDHPAMQVFERVLTILEEAEIPVFVYVVPARMGLFRDAGIFDQDGLDLTLRNLTSITERHGGYILDLSQQFSEPAFRDLGGHLHFEAPYDGPTRVGQMLANNFVGFWWSRTARAGGS